MIKQALTTVEYNMCVQYLRGKKADILPETILFYILNNDSGKVDAVAGFNRHMGSFIEPLYAETRISAFKLFYFMLGLLKGYGSSYVFVRSDNDKVLNFVIVKEKFLVYNSTHNIYYKEI